MILRSILAGSILLIGLQSALAGSRILALLASGDREAQAMTLVLANQLQAAGHSVEILLCGPAGDIATKTPSVEATTVVTPQGASVRTLAEKLMAQGGKLNVCAIYLPNRKLTPDALMTGVGIAKPSEVAATIADPLVKVIGQ